MAEGTVTVAEVEALVHRSQTFLQEIRGEIQIADVAPTENDKIIGGAVVDDIDKWFDTGQELTVENVLVFLSSMLEMMVLEDEDEFFVSPAFMAWAAILFSGKAIEKWREQERVL